MNPDEKDDLKNQCCLSFKIKKLTFFENVSKENIFGLSNNMSFKSGFLKIQRHVFQCFLKFKIYKTIFPRNTKKTNEFF